MGLEVMMISGVMVKQPKWMELLSILTKKRSTIIKSWMMARVKRIRLLFKKRQVSF